MYKRTLNLLLAVLMPFYMNARVIPSEGAALNYRIIGFSAPAGNTGRYVLEIASGTYDNEDSFKRNVVKVVDYTNGKTTTEVPAFGAQYTWRVVKPGAHAVKAQRLHHFSTMTVPEVDIENVRLRVTKPADKYRDAYVFLDNNKVLYDVNGSPVWFLPRMAEEVRDLKITTAGTITFMTGQKNEEEVFEVNYNGKVLWKGPNDGGVNGDKTEHYHHEFTRLANGHYMTMGMQQVLVKQHLSYDQDSVLYRRFNVKRTGDSANLLWLTHPFGTLIEYDALGKVVWKWTSEKYFLQSDLRWHKNKQTGYPTIDLHENSFFFDNKNSVIYLSYNRSGRIIKIKYPEGTVINEYGETYGQDGSRSGSGDFCGQHSCHVSAEGYLYLFNNNTCGPGVFPLLEMFQETAPGKNELKKVWEYECTDESAQPGTAGGFPAGGNIMQLSDRSMFASTAAPSANVFIIGSDKTLLFNAVSEKRTNDRQWHTNGTYRASIIENRVQLEKLIWNSEN